MTSQNSQPSHAAPGPAALAPVLRWGLLIGLSALLTTGFELLHLPAALLLGPMGAAILLALRGQAVPLPAASMTMAQGLVGLMIATILPASILAEMALKWPIVLAGTLSTLMMSGLLGWGMARSGLLPGTTAIWGSSPGAASVMTVISQDYGADMRLVAFMQYLRVACVALTAALVARGFGVTPGSGPAIVWFPPLPLSSLALTLSLAAALAFGGNRARVPGGSFLVPMLGGMALIQLGLVQIVLPPWLLALAYTAIGWAIGLRFTPAILSHVARIFPRVFGSILALLAACGCAAWVLVRFAGIDPLTAYLATSPGGADSVAIIAASAPVDVPFVMSMQMARFLLILFIGPAMARLLSGSKTGPG